MKMKMFLVQMAVLFSLSGISAFADYHCDDSFKYQSEHIVGSWLNSSDLVIELAFDAKSKTSDTLVLTSAISLSGAGRQFKYIDGWYKSGKEGDGASVQVSCTDPNKLYVRYYFQSFGGGDMRYHDYVLEFTRQN